jgi:hypothetical protein
MVQKALGGLTDEEIMSHYGLAPPEYDELRANPVFMKLVEGERARAERYGDRAAFHYKAEAMAIDLSERLFQRIVAEGEIKDLLKFYELMSKAAGLDQPPRAEQERAPGVAIQINCNLEKLRHLG